MSAHAGSRPVAASIPTSTPASTAAPALAFATAFALVATLAAALLVASPARAAEVAGIEIADRARVGGETLALRGAGIRKRLFLKLYVAALYGGEDGASGAEIAAADAPMMIRIAIRSDLVTRDKMIDALNDGFAKSTGGDTAPVQDGIDEALAGLPDALGAGDVIDIVYAPDTGTVMAREGEVLATVEGLPFKEALFGIWLADAPVQADLKEAMLGG